MGSIVKTIGYLPNNQYNSSSVFPVSGSNLYAWNLNSTSSFDGSAWNGGISLSGTGTTTTVDHLGNTTYCGLDGSTTYFSTSDPTFDTANESFTVFGWWKMDTPPTGSNTFASKWEETGNHRSWVVYANATDLVFFLSADGATFGSGNLQAPLGNLTDGNWHFLAAQYDSPNGTLSLYVDGKIVGHQYFSAIQNTRYNSSGSDLLVGAFSIGGVTGYAKAGGISDFGYYKGVMSFDEIRQAYLIGSQKLGYSDNGRIRIMGETGPLGHWTILATERNTVWTSPTKLTDAGYQQYMPINGIGQFVYQANFFLSNSSADLNQFRMYLYNETQSQELAGSSGIYAMIVNGYSGSGTRQAGTHISLDTGKKYFTAGDEIVPYVSSASNVNVQLEDPYVEFTLWDY